MKQILGLLALLTACEAAGIEEKRSPVAEFQGFYSSETRTLRIQSVGRSARGIEPLDVRKDGVSGFGDPETIELVTDANSLGACSGPTSFGGNVTLNSFYGGQLTNLVAQITFMNPPVGHGPLLSDPPFQGLDASLGLWTYPAGSGSMRTWCFETVATGDFRFRGVVWGDINAPATIATFSPAPGVWFLRQPASPGPPTVPPFTFGPSLLPITGDWNGDGTPTIGVYDSNTGNFFLRNSNSAGAADIPPFAFGPAGVPLAGDWNGDGVDTIGIYQPSTGAFFLRNQNSAGPADLPPFVFGGPGLIPLTGDWNGDGIDTIGLYDNTSNFFLRDSNSSGPPSFGFTFGGPGLIPLTGDWNGDGTDTIGVFTPGNGTWFLRNSNSAGAPDAGVFTFGDPNGTPITFDR